jgi:hypothetical protein
VERRGDNTIRRSARANHFPGEGAGAAGWLWLFDSGFDSLFDSVFDSDFDSDFAFEPLAGRDLPPRP